MDHFRCLTCRHTFTKRGRPDWDGTGIKCPRCHSEDVDLEHVGDTPAEAAQSKRQMEYKFYHPQDVGKWK